MLRLFCPTHYTTIAWFSGGRSRLMMVMVTIVIAIMSPRVVVALGVAAIFIVVNGVLGPVVMLAFPAVEEGQTVAGQRQPHIAGTQIVILVADHADVFGAIIHIGIRNTTNGDSDRRRGR